MLWTNLSIQTDYKIPNVQAMLPSSLTLKPNVERIYQFRQVVKYQMFRAMLSSSLILKPNVNDKFIIKKCYKIHTNCSGQCYHPAWFWNHMLTTIVLSSQVIKHQMFSQSYHPPWFWHQMLRTNLSSRQVIKYQMFRAILSSIWSMTPNFK